MNSWLVPFARLGLGGVTPIDTRVAGVTVSVVDPDTLPSVALIVVEPDESADPSPSKPEVLLTVATLVLEELHRTCAVRFCVELSV